MNAGPPANPVSPAPRWTAIRDELKARREMRGTMRAMERDLAACSTPAQLQELRAIVSRYEGPDAEMVRGIVNRHIA
jgi:hypothetical protein